MRSRTHHREIPSATKRGLLTFELNCGPMVVFCVFSGQIFAAADTRTAASVCAHNAACGEAHSWWTANLTNRAVPWLADKNGRGPSPPSSLPSLLRPCVLNVPCFLACNGPSHPHPSLLSTLPFLCPPLPSSRVMENWLGKGHNEVHSYIAGGQLVWTVFSGSRRVVANRPQFQKKKKLPRGSQIIYRFHGVAYVQP